MRKAKKQGRHRFERGTNFFNDLIELGVENNLPFRWRYQTVPGVAHDNAGMSLAASEFLLRRSLNSIFGNKFFSCTKNFNLSILIHLVQRLWH